MLMKVVVLYIQFHEVSLESLWQLMRTLSKESPNNLQRTCAIAKSLLPWVAAWGDKASLGYMNFLGIFMSPEPPRRSVP